MGTGRTMACTGWQVIFEITYSVFRSQKLKPRLFIVSFHCTILKNCAMEIGTLSNNDSASLKLEVCAVIVWKMMERLHFWSQCCRIYSMIWGREIRCSSIRGIINGKNLCKTAILLKYSDTLTLSQPDGAVSHQKNLVQLRGN